MTADGVSDQAPTISSSSDPAKGGTELRVEASVMPGSVHVPLSVPSWRMVGSGRDAVGGPIDPIGVVGGALDGLVGGRLDAGGGADGGTLGLVGARDRSRGHAVGDRVGGL
jgi:hypothetical protein